MYQCHNVQYHYDHHGHDDDDGVVMITTRSILNMMNIVIEAEYVHEWFKEEGVRGGDGDLPVKQTW